MRWLLLVLVLAMGVPPTEAALTVQTSDIAYGASPEQRATIDATLSMPCSDVIKEEAESRAEPYRNLDDQPPVVFQFRIWPEDTSNWLWGTVTPPEAPTDGAYYIPDLDYCHKDPMGALEYNATFGVTPLWTVAAGTVMNASVYGYVVGTDATVYGPNPRGEQTVQVRVQHALRAGLPAHSPKAWLYAGEPQDVDVAFNVRSNYNLSARVDVRDLVGIGECMGGSAGAVPYPLEVVAGPTVNINRTEDAWDWMAPSQYTASASIRAEAPSAKAQWECGVLRQTEEISLVISAARTDGTPIEDAYLYPTIEWWLEWPIAAPVDHGEVNQRQLSSPSLLVVLLGIVLAAFSLRARVMEKS